MNSVAGHLNLPRRRGKRSVAGRYHLACSCLLLLLTLFCGAVKADTDARNLRSVPAGPGLPFAIDDFDGDLRPDLASVQTGRTDFARADYWIQLQFATGGRQSFQVVASIGGLKIAARDVNGDRAVDLVLTTALFGQPVAVFLNDGHGSFSRAEPSAFPGAFTGSEKSLVSHAEEIKDATALSFRDPRGTGSNGGKFASPLNVAKESTPRVLCNLPSTVTASFLGRAPPPPSHI